MKDELFPKGSEWRIWDLHVHSPVSHNVGGDFDDFVIQLGNSKCDVIGINDYFSVDGYKTVRSYLDGSDAPAQSSDALLDALKKLRRKKLLPVVECRMTNIVQGRDGKGNPRINFHIIFDDQLPIDEVETAIKAFELSDNSTISSNYSNPEFLLNKASVDFNRVHQKLRQNPKLAEHHLIWIPYDEYGGIGDINPNGDSMLKQGFIRKADILGSSNKKQTDFFMWSHPKYSADDFRGWFGRKKPCIKGSDAHSVKEKIGNLKDHESNPTNKFCWIKADPTFSGLRQIVHEPENRVFIGEKPPKLIHFEGNRHNYLTGIEIKPKEANASDVGWFNTELELNHDMVAVIGNKGNGKSALLDILALAGNTRNYGYFSFLEKKKFRERNGKLASQFEVKARWADGSETVQSLQQDPDPDQPERVRYLPQSYLEKICTETTPDLKSQFQQEIKKVIFSHIDDSKRLGKTSLDDLIEFHVEEIRERISEVKSDIRKLNYEIVKIELASTDEALKSLVINLQNKKEQLKAFDEQKPKEVVVPTPDTDDPEAVDQRNILTEKQKQREQLQKKVIAANREKSELNQKIANTRKVSEKLQGLEERIRSVKTEIGEGLKSIGLSVDQVIAYQIQHSKIKQSISNLEKRLQECEDKLDKEQPKSLLAQLSILETNISNIQKKMDEPTKLHQTYLKELENWQKRRTVIEGTTTTLDSMKYYEKQISDHGQLPIKLTALEVKRKNLCQQIHSELKAIEQVFQRLFAPLSELIVSHPIIAKQMKLSFETKIFAGELREILFKTYIRQDVIGTFQNTEEGLALLDSFIEDTDTSETDSVVGLAQKLTNSIRKNQKTDASMVDIDKQFRKGKSRTEVYDYLWSLEYLNPEFSLRMDGKELSQLSPGERGLLLLVFFLLLDMGETPIIIDQPEENLDNQTVFNLLVPAVQNVKQRRQVIMVTHSPNIAVVCDADQIIYCEIDRANNNKVTYTSGAIESGYLNQAALDVLEGTLPSFENRREKYFT